MLNLIAITGHTAAEIKKLERAVSAFFDYIEGIIERPNTSMESSAESLCTI